MKKKMGLLMNQVRGDNNTEYFKYQIPCSILQKKAQTNKKHKQKNTLIWI